MLLRACLKQNPKTEIFISMLNLLFDTSNPFTSYTYLHWWPLIFFTVFLGAIIVYARKKMTHEKRITVGVLLSLLPAFAVIFRMVCTYLDGTFTIQEELPFQLCRTLAFAFPFVIYYQSRKWFGVFYFFTIVGTLQAILTPDLPLSAPHHSYWTYWVLHCVLIGLPIYCLVNFNWKVTIKDFWNAIIVVNLYMVFTGVINYLIGSNYFYTSHKPPGPTLLDVFGPWPWYIAVVELLTVFLFFLAGLPFWVSRKH